MPTRRIPLQRKRIFVVSVAALVFVAITVVGSLAPLSSGREPVRTFTETDPVVGVRLTLDTLDAARGVLRVRVSILADEAALPPEGATLFTDLPGIASVSLPIEQVTADKSSEAVLESGDIGAYPLDAYRQTFQLLLVPGHLRSAPSEPPARTLPMQLEVADALPGFVADASFTKAPSGVMDIGVDMPRQWPTVIWASAMIGVYWLLAISAFAVVLATALGLRVFETRHLAWLVAMIFAFAAFRGTAPGAPPIGVFLDFASFFWAEAIVALSLVVLVIFYLTGDRGAPPAPALPAPPRGDDADAGGPADQPGDVVQQTGAASDPGRGATTDPVAEAPPPPATDLRRDPS